MKRLTELIEWIPVGERLPDDCRTVIVLCEKSEFADVTPGFFHHEGQWYCPVIGRPLKAIAWAEMPKGEMVQR